MKIKYKFIKIASICAGVVLNGLCVNAQSVDINTPASLELKKDNSFWNQSSNAAGLSLDNPIKYTDVAFSYQHTDGNFKRPQEGAYNNRMVFDIEGGTFVESLYLWGAFKFDQDGINNADYNASLANPFRGMPFMQADLNRSDWRNQHYDMQFKVATPLYVGKMAFGLDMSYGVSQAAKQRDVRAVSLFYNLDITPGIVYSINDHHLVGGNFNYYNVKEAVSSSLENSDDNQTYYLLYGLGTSEQYLGTGRSIDYKGDRIGGELQYNYENSGINFLASVNYSRKAETAETGSSKLEKFGATKEDLWKANASLLLDGDRFSNRIQAKYTNSDMDGIQYISQNTSQQGWVVLDKNIRSTYKSQNASLDYTLVAKRANEYAWQVGAGVDYQKRNDEYILPFSYKDVENIGFSVKGKVNLNISDKLTRRLVLGAAAKYNNNIDGAYVYNGQNAGTPIVLDLEQGDLNYLASDYYQLIGEFTYSQKWKENSPANLYVKGSFAYQNTNDFDFNTRRVIAFSVGACF